MGSSFLNIFTSCLPFLDTGALPKPTSAGARKPSKDSTVLEKAKEWKHRIGLKLNPRARGYAKVRRNLEALELTDEAEADSATDADAGKKELGGGDNDFWDDVDDTETGESESDSDSDAGDHATWGSAAL